jgi:hypothetical protein
MPSSAQFRDKKILGLISLSRAHKAAQQLVVRLTSYFTPFSFREKDFIIDVLGMQLDRTRTSDVGVRPSSWHHIELSLSGLEAKDGIRTLRQDN